MYTNIDGKYAWDVPEGWWRVKYEKNGYETTWSEWLPVPPIQTEVNIGMKPVVVEDYAVKLESRTSTSATVSLKNNTQSTVPIQLILAAYDDSGRMIGNNTISQELGVSGSTDIVLTYPSSKAVAKIKAFVLSSDTQVPLRDTWVMQINQ